jgi:hypothetical protein
MCPFGQCVGGRIIQAPEVDRTSSPTAAATLTTVIPRAWTTARASAGLCSICARVAGSLVSVPSQVVDTPVHARRQFKERVLAPASHGRVAKPSYLRREPPHVAGQLLQFIHGRNHSLSPTFRNHSLEGARRPARAEDRRPFAHRTAQAGLAAEKRA